MFGALVAVPSVWGDSSTMNLFFFTLMYAVCASAWNILGGYSGYISLGHAAFFGIGAYAIAITFTRTGIGGGYRPFYVLPLVGIAGALISLPVGWIAFRTRAATFAIVTISFLFIVQLLAFNLHSVTSGAQGLAIPTPNFPVSSYEHPFYYAMLGCSRSRSSRAGTCAGASSGSRSCRFATTRTGRVASASRPSLRNSPRSPSRQG